MQYIILVYIKTMIKTSCHVSTLNIISAVRIFDILWNRNRIDFATVKPRNKHISSTISLQQLLIMMRLS